MPVPGAALSKAADARGMIACRCSSASSSLQFTYRSCKLGLGVPSSEVSLHHPSRSSCSTDGGADEAAATSDGSAGAVSTAAASTAAPLTLTEPYHAAAEALLAAEPQLQNSWQHLPAHLADFSLPMAAQGTRT